MFPDITLGLASTFLYYFKEKTDGAAPGRRNLNLHLRPDPQGHFLFTEMKNGRIFIMGKIKGMDSNHMEKGKLVLCCGEVAESLRTVY